MSNFLNFALGGLVGGLAGSPLQSVLRSPLQGLTGSRGTAPLGGAQFSGVAGLLSRDSQMPELAGLTSSTNLLAQAASDQPLLLLPPLAPMPAPAKAPAVPTDDHGQSNIVFADGATDGPPLTSQGILTA